MGFNPLLLGALVVLNIPVYYLIYKIMFKDWDDFTESIRLGLMPDIISLFRGEYWDDCWAELKLTIWMGGCVGAVALEYSLIYPLLSK